MGSGSSVQRSSGKAAADQPGPSKSAGQNNVASAGGGASIPQLDKQLPFANYREWYNLKNFWKTIQRNKDNCAKTMLFKYLSKNQDCKAAYGKLGNVDLQDEEIAFNNSDFENLANQYLDVFDEAITGIESNPGDASSVVDELRQIGKRHKKVPGMQAANFAKLQDAFIDMAREVLQDRFSDKCEQSFVKLFSFVEKNVAKGFDGA